jgi:hypothetical protein
VTEVTPKGGRETARIIERLDKLIDLYFDSIAADPDKHAKLGDLLKMIDLRQKLLPDNSNQKQFWDMIERICQEKLPAKAKSVRRQPKARSTREKAA